MYFVFISSFKLHQIKFSFRRYNDPLQFLMKCKNLNATFKHNFLSKIPVTYTFLSFHHNGFLVFLGYQETGEVGGLQHVDKEVIGQNVQLLLVVTGNILSTGHTKTEKQGA